ncbi:flagellar hook-length control protein FliK [Campylobacter sp.]|uniref:flagellar hook-length control protein FliK n=1 Tax=Campylobacter sp. TaxID=205 RepID=UPI002A54C465|nr:flagellar hook-length control protein FliK [Campylobacter sp.]MDD7090786.1 flagellar hook-length control protein FliK [Campylobacteraceae bacterium]MDY5285090.1 flagellar hook-length control protein FliK [Campylobacter sp.]
MLNLQTTASSKNEQNAIQSATQKKKEGGNGDFLGALLASLSKDTSHTSSNVSNENKAPQSTSNTQNTQSTENTQNTQSTENTSQNSFQTEFGEQNSQEISKQSSQTINQNSSEEAISQNSSEEAISDTTLEEGKSVALSELSASKGDVSTENMPEQEAINDEGFMQVLSVLEGIFGGEAPNIAKISSSLEKLISIEENLAQLKDVKDLKDLLKIAEKLKLGLEKLSITSEALGALKSKFPALDKANFFKPIDISLNQAALSAKNAKPAQPVVLASLLGKTAPKSITQVLKEAELEAPKTSKTAPKESGLKGLLNGDDIKTKAPKQSANEIVEKAQNKVEQKVELKSAATEKDLLKISEKSTKEPKIAPSPLPSAPKVAKSEVNELKAFDIQNYLNSISKKAASETTAPSGSPADMQPSGESHPSFGDAIENRLSDNNFKDMIAALKMQDKIISRDIQQNSVRSFAAQMVEKISEFKPPVTRVNLQLHPAELGEVNITMIARANNLHVNVTSANATMALFLQNQAEFKANLVNMGFSDIQMSFSDHKEGSNTQQNANKAKKSYESDEDGVIINEFEGSGESTLEIVLPRYI